MSTIRSSINIAMSLSPYIFFEGKPVQVNKRNLTQYALQHGDPVLFMSYEKTQEPATNGKPFSETLALVVEATAHITEDQLRGMAMDLAFLLLRRRGFDAYEVFGALHASVVNMQPFSRMCSTGVKYDQAFGSYVDIVTENLCHEGDNRYLVRVVVR